jgi:hypothetical protein
MKPRTAAVASGLATVVGIVAALCGGARADEFTLKNGETFRGSLLGIANEDTLIVRLSDGTTRRVKRDDVAKRVEERAEEKPQKPPAPVPPPPPSNDARQSLIATLERRPAMTLWRRVIYLPEIDEFHVSSR